MRRTVASSISGLDTGSTTAPDSPHTAAAAFAHRSIEQELRGLEALYLFGSTARGDTAGVSSDVDVLAIVADEADRRSIDTRRRFESPVARTVDSPREDGRAGCTDRRYRPRVPIDGSAADGYAASIRERGGAVFRNCTITQTGADCGGIRINDADECHIIDSRTDTTGVPLTVENTSLST